MLYFFLLTLIHSLTIYPLPKDCVSNVNKILKYKSAIFKKKNSTVRPVRSSFHLFNIKRVWSKFKFSKISKLVKFSNLSKLFLKNILEIDSFFSIQIYSRTIWSIHQYNKTFLPIRKPFCSSNIVSISFLFSLLGSNLW